MSRLPHDGPLAHLVKRRLRDVARAQAVTSEDLIVEACTTCRPLDNPGNGIRVERSLLYDSILTHTAKDRPATMPDSPSHRLSARTGQVRVRAKGNPYAPTNSLLVSLRAPHSDSQATWGEFEIGNLDGG